MGPASRRSPRRSTARWPPPAGWAPSWKTTNGPTAVCGCPTRWRRSSAPNCSSRSSSGVCGRRRQQRLDSALADLSSSDEHPAYVDGATAAEGVSAMGWLSLWWREADHYDRLSFHLQARGMATLIRAAISLIAAGLSVDALGTIWTSTGPRGIVSQACTLTAAVSAAVGALLWALRWPTRAAATGFAVLSTASIALIALAQHNPLISMLTCATFVATASYIALFHGAPLMAYNFAIACVVGGVEAVRLAGPFGA